MSEPLSLGIMRLKESTLSRTPGQTCVTPTTWERFKERASFHSLAVLVNGFEIFAGKFRKEKYYHRATIDRCRFISDLSLLYIYIGISRVSSTFSPACHVRGRETDGAGKRRKFVSDNFPDGKNIPLRMPGKTGKVVWFRQAKFAHLAAGWAAKRVSASWNCTSVRDLVCT